MNIVFLGGGRITSAMLAGLRLARTKYRLIVHDRNRSKLRDLQKHYAIVPEPDLQGAVDRAEMLLIAVRPASVGELLRSIGEVDRALLGVSLAAGIPLRMLSKAAGSRMRWARAMPSPVCRSGRGLTAVTFARALPQRERESVRALFAAFGSVVEIAEKKFDAFTVIYSCSHGYRALAALANAAQRIGLDRENALLASAHALADSIIAWRDGKDSLAALLDEAATPGGISATAGAAMDAAGYRRAIRRGVAAGLQRARANARQSFERS